MLVCLDPLFCSFLIFTCQRQIKTLLSNFLATLQFGPLAARLSWGPERNRTVPLQLGEYSLTMSFFTEASWILLYTMAVTSVEPSTRSATSEHL